MRPDWTIPKINTDIKYNLSNNICIDTELSLPTVPSVKLSVYPDEYPIYTVIAKHHNVDIENVAIGLGLGELLQRIYLHINLGTITVLSPTWPLAEIYLTIENINYRSVKYTNFNQLNFNVLLSNPTDSIYLANPNGVNGTMLTRSQIILLLARYKLVILDEAYMDFADESMIADLSSHKNLIILKTFSKSIALPGLRLGYCLAAKDIIERLQLVRPSCVAHGTTVELTESILLKIPEHVKRMLKTKQYIESKYKTLPTYGNYVLFQGMPPIQDHVAVKEVHPNIYRMALFNQQLLSEVFDGYN